MITLHYKLTSYYDLLDRLGSLLGTKPVENVLTIPNEFGEGFFKVIPVEEKLEAFTYHLKLNDQFLFKREKEDREFYVLTFDEVDTSLAGAINIGSDTSGIDTNRKTALYLTSFLYDIEYTLQKNIEVKGVRILLDAVWMKKYLQLNEKEDVLEKYINLKTAGIWYMPVDSELKDLLNDIVSTQPIPLLFYQNKLFRIIEKFFSWLYNELQSFHNTAGISKNDILLAQKIESIITNDITIVPPTIKELARCIAISESKLKKIFKIVYGLPPYEYYQKQRMQKAKQMLLSGDYSIKDVGYTLGYSNLSNFTLAFKKEFGALPSDVLKGRLK